MGGLQLTDSLKRVEFELDSMGGYLMHLWQSAPALWLFVSLCLAARRSPSWAVVEPVAPSALRRFWHDLGWPFRLAILLWFIGEVVVEEFRE